ncbi:hypothetical protein AB0I94_28665 [Streptomyces sp. NPDC050147]|uniref:hypothetical protein n=1 Tax=Streptomyces sp. NPDC050147 TaxID=3155513 RepID=UPI00341BF6E6
MGVERDSAKDYLYYASDWIWDIDFETHIKSLLLFFDGVAFSLPGEAISEVINRSSGLAQPLTEHGLLINLVPEETLPVESSAQLAEALTQWVTDNRDLLASMDEPYEALTPQHWGVRPHEQVREAEVLSATLRRLGLAYPTHHQDIWHLSPHVHLLVLMFYCKALHRAIQQRSDITLQPVFEAHEFKHTYGFTPRQLIEMVMSSSSLTTSQRRGSVRIVESDIRQVGVDLTHVPLDEILDFRRQHRDSLRSYVRGLRGLLLAAEHFNNEQFEAELRERANQIDQEARELRRATRRAFGATLAGSALSIAGAAWTATQGDLVGALLATAAAGVTFTPPSQPATAYSYFFQIDRRFG